MAAQEHGSTKEKSRFSKNRNKILGISGVLLIGFSVLILNQKEYSAEAYIQSIPKITEINNGFHPTTSNSGKEDLFITTNPDISPAIRSENNAGNNTTQTEIHIAEDLNQKNAIVPINPENENIEIADITIEQNDLQEKIVNSEQAENSARDNLAQTTPENRSIINEELLRIESVGNEYNQLLKGFYAGITGGYNYTTIAEDNPTGYDNTPIQSTGKLGNIKGVSVGYNFNQSFGLQLEYLFNSMEGSNYELAASGSGAKTLHIIYDQIPLTINYKVPQLNYLNNRLKVINLYAGLQYNILKSYHLPQEKRYEDLENVFKPNTISFVSGIDYNVNIFSSVFVSLGARATLSSGITGDNYPISDNAAHSFTLGAKAGLFYQFAAK